MNDTWVTLQGWVGSDVELRDAAGAQVASFRLGCTPRYLRNGEWVDGTTSWYTVNTWRTLARNVADSVHKREPVVVFGRLRADVWEREGHPPSVTHVVEASFVGHDLNRGIATFARAAKRDRVDSGEHTVKEMVHALPADEPQLSSEGVPKGESGRETGERAVTAA